MTIRKSILANHPPCTELYDFLSRKTTNKELAWQATLKIHSYVLLYRRSIRTLKIRKQGAQIETVRSHRRVVEALERLRRAKSEYTRGKAFRELPAAAKMALSMAAERLGVKTEYQSHPTLLYVPYGNTISSLVPKAIEIANRKDPEIAKSNMFTRANPARDRAIEEIMRAYRHLHGGRKPPVKLFEAFLEEVAACYKELIPEGFGGGVRTNHTYDATFRRILSQSLLD